MKKIKYLLLIIICLFLNIKVVSADNILSTNGRICMDYPISDSTYGDKMIVQGWIMSEDKNTYLKILLDGKDIESTINRYERIDVINAIKGYGGFITNPTPGYTTTIDLSNYDNGNHKVEVIAYSGDNKLISSVSRKIVINKNKIISVIDYPIHNSNYSGKINVQGWTMGTNTINDIKLYIDNEMVDYNYNRTTRNDVLNIIKGYGDISNNPLPGYAGEIDINKYNNGKHNLKLEFYSDNVLVNTVNKDIEINNIARVRVDYPRDSIINNNIYFQGWVMKSSKNQELEFYIDDNKIFLEYDNVKRNDVINVIKGYSDITINNSPGFSGYYDMSEYKDGEHKFKVVVIDNDKIISSDERLFNLTKYKTTMRLDSPTTNKNIEGTILELNGWYLSTNKDSYIELLVNNIDKTEWIERNKREDAIQAYGKTYNADNNTIAGYNAKVDVSEIKDGNVEIKVNIKDRNTGEILDSITRSVLLTKYKTTMRLDSPATNKKIEGTTLELNGWYLSTNKDSYIELLVNNIDKTEWIERNQREDAIQAYGKTYNADNNTIAGYNAKVDVSEIKDGNVEIKVNIKDRNTGEILDSITRSVLLTKYKTTMRLDSPATNKKIEGTTLELNGWYLSTNKDSYIELLVNNIDKTEWIERNQREDAIQAYGKTYNADNNTIAGYNAKVDVSEIKDGNVEIKVNIKDRNTGEILDSITRSVVLKKYNGIICIDYPTKSNFNKENELLIQGWELSEDQNSYLKIFIDNNEIELNRYEREDVLSVYNENFGGRENNKMPGYTTSISLNNYTDGTHRISIKLYNNMDELIEEKNTLINVYSNIYFGIDVSSYQNVNWDVVSKSGLDFAIIRLGYGDNFTSQDDKKFIENVEGCKRNNIPYGIYLYSYATEVKGTSEINKDSASSDSEAYHTLRLLNSLSNEQKSYLKLPVFLDMEDPSTVHLGKEKLTNIADNYCTIINNNGYKCGIYASKNWLNNNLNREYLSSKYEIWLAHWVESSDYDGIYQLWQYSSTGSLAGIISDGLDMDISYKKYW